MVRFHLRVFVLKIIMKIMNTLTFLYKGEEKEIEVPHLSRTQLAKGFSYWRRNWCLPRIKILLDGVYLEYRSVRDNGNIPLKGYFAVGELPFTVSFNYNLFTKQTSNLKVYYTGDALHCPLPTSRNTFVTWDEVYVPESGDYSYQEIAEYGLPGWKDIQLSDDGDGTVTAIRADDKVFTFTKSKE